MGVVGMDGVGMRVMDFVDGVTNPFTDENRRAKRAMNVGLIMIVLCLIIDA